MPMIHFAQREIHCKVVYYGPGLSGKTTNVKQLHMRAKEDAKGPLISLQTESERTLFFDFVPLNLGKIRGYQVRFHLYTVPGQCFYEASRKLILTGLDGAIFVADSHESRWEANLFSFEEFAIQIAEMGRSLDELPHVIQCNKRDIEHPVPMQAFEAELNTHNAPCIPAVATQCEGVFTCLKHVAKGVLKQLKNG